MRQKKIEHEKEECIEFIPDIFWFGRLDYSFNNYFLAKGKTHQDTLNVHNSKNIWKFKQLIEVKSFM